MPQFKSAKIATVSAVAFAAVLLVGSPVAAQPGSGMRGMMDQCDMMGMGDRGDMMGRGRDGMMGMGMMRMMRMGMMGMAEHVEGRIAFLKTELKITDAQMPQWTAFADALRANARQMSEMCSSMMQGGMRGDAGVSALDRLDRMEKMMTAMTEAVKATKAALAPLYAALTDEQKKMADRLMRGPMGMGRM
jgi:hypothetical protein